MKGPVCHLAASRGARVAIGSSERDVQVWDFEAQQLIVELATLLDFGGRRLALAPDGTVCFSGSYDGRGVLAQDVGTGEPIWHRRDIRNVQRVCASFDGRLLYVGLDDSALTIDATDGATVERLRGVRDVFESPDGGARLYDTIDSPLRFASSTVCTVERTTFAVLDVAFGPTSYCISEAGGPVRCLDSVTGTELWRYQPPPGEHVLHLAYSAARRHFIGVSREYVQTGVHSLLLLSSNGSVAIADLGNVAVTEFCSGGETLLLSDGRVIDVASGSITGQLALEAAGQHPVSSR